MWVAIKNRNWEIWNYPTTEMKKIKIKRIEKLWKTYFSF